MNKIITTGGNTTSQSTNFPKIDLDSLDRLSKLKSKQTDFDNYIAFFQAPAEEETPTNKKPDPIDDIINKLEKESNIPKTTPSKKVDTDENDLIKDVFRTVERTGPIADSMAKQDLRILNKDGSYSDGKTNTKYYWQPGNYLFKENEGKGSTLYDDIWNESLDKPMPWTKALAKLDLVPVPGKNIVFQGQELDGYYYLQEDGSIWYDGGANSQKKTYENGSWNVEKKSPLPSTLLVDKAGLKYHPITGLIDSKYPRVKCYPLSNGNLVYIGPSANEEKRVWITKPNEAPSTPHPLSKIMIENGYTPNVDGSWKGIKYPGKYFLQMDGTMVYQGKSTNGKQSIWICNKNGEWKKSSIPCSEELAKTNLEVDDEGHVKLKSYSGKFLLREDGSEVYIGGNNDGVKLVWIDASSTEKKRMHSHPASKAIVELNLTPNSEDSSWSAKDTPGKYFPQDDGSIKYINGEDRRKYVNGQWYLDKPVQPEPKPQPEEKEHWFHRWMRDLDKVIMYI